MMSIFSIKINWLPIGIFILSCTAIPYGQAASPHNYVINPIDKSTMYVAYSNNQYTTRDLVEHEVFKKCAELTLQSGFSFFTLNENQLSSQLISNNYSSDEVKRFNIVKTKNGKLQYESYAKPVVTIAQLRFTVSTQLKMTLEKPENSPTTYYDAIAAANGQVRLIGHFPRINRKSQSESNQLVVADTASE